MPPRWLAAALGRVRALAAQRKVHFTLKAIRELARLDLGLDEEDACDVLANIIAAEFAERVRSKTTASGCTSSNPKLTESACTSR